MLVQDADVKGGTQYVLRLYFIDVDVVQHQTMPNNSKVEAHRLADLHC